MLPVLLNQALEGKTLPRRIAVLGAGANGASVAADLARAGANAVLIDQWPENVERIRKHGLTVELPDETLRVPITAMHLCELGTIRDKFDTVLMLVKAYDSDWARTGCRWWHMSQCAV